MWSSSLSFLPARGGVASCSSSSSTSVMRSTSSSTPPCSRLGVRTTRGTGIRGAAATAAVGDSTPTSASTLTRGPADHRPRRRCSHVSAASSPHRSTNPSHSHNSALIARRSRRKVSAASTPVESEAVEPPSSSSSSSSPQSPLPPAPPAPLPPPPAPSADQQDEALAAARLLEVEVDEAEARGETVAATLGLAAAIGAGLYALKGPETAQAYFAGYLLEQSLSVDNLFVFVLIFRYFNVSAAGQDRVLAWGIASAAVLRLLMVAAGAELIENFKPVLLAFAAILVYSSIKLAFVDDGGEGNDDEDLSDNAVVKLCRKVLTVSDEYDGVKFFTDVPVEGGGGGGGGGSDSSNSSSGSNGTIPRRMRVATPLLLVLAVIEVSDVVFAVDSVPAVFGVSRDPVVVWSASMAAIASLRALYGFVATALGSLRFLDKAVAAVLAWVGGKMVFEFFSGVEVSTALSLGVVVACLAVGVGASLAVPEEK